MRGKINAIILCTLKNENRYGLQIIKEIKNLTNGQVDIKLPSLYNTLHKLESDGFITSYWENSEIGGKRRYSALTDKGRKYIDEHPYDFSVFEKFANVNKSNAPSALAIQPDFFNTIAHSQKDKNSDGINVADENGTNENQIENYSILDYINDNDNKSINTNEDASVYPTCDESVANNGIESLQLENDNTREVEHNDVFANASDKNDAVLLSDTDIIPQNDSISLLYQPSTITNENLNESPIDYDGIFGNMIERDVAKATLFSDQDELSDSLSNDYNNSINFNQNKNEHSIVNKQINTIQQPNVEKSGEYYNKNNIDEFLLRDKITIEDKYKANIFLRKSNFLKSEYDFFSSSPKYSEDSFKEIKYAVNSNPNVFLNGTGFDKKENSESITLEDFIEDCKLKGINITCYRNECSLPTKPIQTNIKKSMLNSSLLSFGCLTALFILLFLLFRDSLSNPQILSLFIPLYVVFVSGIIIDFAINTNKKTIQQVKYNVKKSLLPRIAVIISIILLTIAVNILCGLNINNIQTYTPYLVVPIVSSFMMLADYIIKIIYLNI